MKYYKATLEWGYDGVVDFDIKQELVAWLFKKLDQPKLTDVDVVEYLSVLDWALNGD